MIGDVYGPSVPDTVIEGLLLDQLRKWIESYLGDVERITGREKGEIAKPKSWGVPQARFDKWPHQMTPHIAVISEGTTGTPDRDGEQRYDAAFNVSVTCVVAASTPNAVEALAKHYIHAVEKLLLEQPVGSPVEEIVWLGHQPEDVASDKGNTLTAMTARFTVYVRDVFVATDGPLEPEDPDPREPSPDDPELEVVSVSINP